MHDLLPWLRRSLPLRPRRRASSLSECYTGAGESSLHLADSFRAYLYRLKHVFGSKEKENKPKKEKKKVEAEAAKVGDLHLYTCLLEQVLTPLIVITGRGDPCCRPSP
jgi:hypothetical protein